MTLIYARRNDNDIILVFYLSTVPRLHSLRRTIMKRKLCRFWGSHILIDGNLISKLFSFNDIFKKFLVYIIKTEQISC